MRPVQGKGRNTRGKMTLINIMWIYNKITLKLLCVCSDVIMLIYNKSLSLMLKDYELLL